MTKGYISAAFSAHILVPFNDYSCHSKNVVLDETHKRRQVCGLWALGAHAHCISVPRPRSLKTADVTHQVDEGGGGEPDAGVGGA